MTDLPDQSTDYVLVTDKSFKKYAKAYADSEEVFFKECVHLTRFYLSLASLSNSRFPPASPPL
jgi:hypothetical protein